MKEQDAAHSFEKTPIWYTKDQMYDWLIRENYSEQIAKELSGKWSEDLQGAFNKGYEKSVKELTRLRSELQQKYEWISVDNNLPPHRVRVIVWNDIKATWKVDYLLGNNWYDSSLNEITHWLQIKPPNVK